MNSKKTGISSGTLVGVSSTNSTCIWAQLKPHLRGCYREWSHAHAQPDMTSVTGTGSMSAHAQPEVVQYSP